MKDAEEADENRQGVPHEVEDLLQDKVFVRAAHSFVPAGGAVDRNL